MRTGHKEANFESKTLRLMNGCRLFVVGGSDGGGDTANDDSMQYTIIDDANISHIGMGIPYHRLALHRIFGQFATEHKPKFTFIALHSLFVVVVVVSR